MVTLVAPAVAVGDTVLIDAHAGLEVKDGDQPFTSFVKLMF